jgi:hypothetical protein
MTNDRRTRDPIVVAVECHDIRGRCDIDGAPVWGWADPAAPGAPTCCRNLVEGDYVIHYHSRTEDGRRRRKRRWAVHKAHRSRFTGSVTVNLWGGISHHAGPEAAAAAARRYLREDRRRIDAARRAACAQNLPTACPDAHICRHGIDS